MNIKINIKDCDCQPAIISRNEMSEVEWKKKSMLYAPPTKDKKGSNAASKKTMKHNNPQQVNNTLNSNPLSRNTQGLNNTQLTQNGVNSYNQDSFFQAEKKLVQDLSSISKNQATMDMANHSNTVLQRQTQIIEQNQKTLNNLVSNSNSQSNDREVKRLFEESADKIAKQVQQIKKMRDQILRAGQQFKKMLSQSGRHSNVNQNNKAPEKIGQMNENLKSLVQVSKNHMEGLENLEGLKNLQNFNIEAYTQSINTLKKQIVQYQKQSQNIQRQLKLRSAKLQKLDVSPNFDEQLLQPYQQHLKKKADSIDMHSIKQKVYQKLGVFDYGKIQNDICMITNEIKNQMNEFGIICKQYRIDIPDIKIDKKQLKQLDLKLPSILEQFKASKGIVFNQEEEDKVESAKNIKSQNGKSQTLKQKKTQILMDLPPAKHVQKKPNTLRTNQEINQQLHSSGNNKPIDYSTNIKLTRTDDNKYKSVLQTKIQRQKREVNRNVNNKNKNQDDDFQKYLANRAKQQLALIYQEKKKKLQNMEKQLYQTCKEQPKYQLNLNIKNKMELKKPKGKAAENKISEEEKQQVQKKDQYDEYNDDFQFEQEKKSKPSPKKSKKEEAQEAKKIGTQALKDRLKNLFSQQPQSLNQPQHLNHHFSEPHMQRGQFQSQSQVQSIAEGFIGMINNTLTQVNSQLSASIQKKRQHNSSLSRQRPSGLQKKSPAKITIPKLEQFRAPPVFNMQLVQQPAYRQEGRKAEKKIVAKNYDHLRINEENDDDLEVSAMSFDD